MLFTVAATLNPRPTCRKIVPVSTWQAKIEGEGERRLEKGSIGQKISLDDGHVGVTDTLAGKLGSEGIGQHQAPERVAVIPVDERSGQGKEAGSKGAYREKGGG